MQLSSQQRIRILHVDDEPSITDLTATVLEREDDQFSVETATTADKRLIVFDVGVYRVDRPQSGDRSRKDLRQTL